MAKTNPLKSNLHDNLHIIEEIIDKKEYSEISDEFKQFIDKEFSLLSYIKSLLIQKESKFKS
tara:strand:- start:625 stop:810 length:186 start_codon:yes stop_codon:yes gene_type:complete